MIKVENIEVYNFEAAIRGMRNPMNSWDKSDSKYVDGKYLIGEKDLDLMKRLYKGGTPHRKYLRQIMVSMDITTNHIIWSEFDTYKVGVTRNSCSKMHKIHVKEFSKDDFSHEGIDQLGVPEKMLFESVIQHLEVLRRTFNSTNDKKYWRALLELLPMSYNLKSTITMNYENVANIIKYRENHKMQEWNDFVEILKSLPYVKEVFDL